MRSTAYDAPSVVSSVSSLAACGLPCCARMAPQCPSVWVSLVAFFLSLRSSVCGRRQSRLVFGSRSPRCGASLAGPSKKAPRAHALAIHHAPSSRRACVRVCTECHPTWVSYSQPRGFSPSTPSFPGRFSSPRWSPRPPPFSCCLYLTVKNFASSLRALCAVCTVFGAADRSVRLIRPCACSPQPPAPSVAVLGHCGAGTPTVHSL